MNIKKTKYDLFHKSSSKDDMPLRLGDLIFANKILHKKWIYSYFNNANIALAITHRRLVPIVFNEGKNEKGLWWESFFLSHAR